MQRLEGDVELVRPHLESPGVGGDRRRSRCRCSQPRGRERQAGGRAAGVFPPAFARARASRPVRTSTMSPRPTVTPCRRRSSVEMLRRDREAVRQLAVRVPTSGRPTSSSTPRPTNTVGQLLDAGDRSPSLVTTVAGGRPFHAIPWSKMWPSPSHWVEHCSGMKITSSAPPIPCGNPWLPARRRGPVSSIVWIGLVRRRQPLLRPVGLESLGEGEARRRGGRVRRPPSAARR